MRRHFLYRMGKYQIVVTKDRMSGDIPRLMNKLTTYQAMICEHLYKHIFLLETYFDGYC